MIDDPSALRHAITLFHVPSGIKVSRREPLPGGIDVLLRIAAGDIEVEQAAARLTNRPAEVIRDASHFFISQILLAPDADSYRRLGVAPDASTVELRRNMALLVKALHPDVDREGDRSVMAARVTRAWEDLKTSERRAAYDRLRETNEAQRARRARDRLRGTAGHSRRARQHVAAHVSAEPQVAGAACDVDRTAPVAEGFVSLAKRLWRGRQA
jgi:DnaJ domain